MASSASKDESNKLSKATLSQVQEVFLKLGQILGLFETIGATSGDEGISEKLIELLINLRQKLRAQKNYELSDEIRDTLKDIGIILEDSKNGSKWKMV